MKYGTFLEFVKIDMGIHINSIAIAPYINCIRGDYQNLKLFDITSRLASLWRQWNEL